MVTFSKTFFLRSQLPHFLAPSTWPYFQVYAPGKQLCHNFDTLKLAGYSSLRCFIFCFWFLDCTSCIPFQLLLLLSFCLFHLCSLKPDGSLDSSSLHGSCPTTKGDKWSATKWIHVGKFGGSATAAKAKWGDCVDSHESCSEWAYFDECKKNPGYMMTNCRLSCKVCTPGEKKPEEGAATSA
jgi:hypothetical protein